MMTRLPVEDALPQLRSTLRAHPGAVLQAPPGAGKTTLVPLALLDEPWLAGGRIVMLEPRRLAARAAAERMAGLLGERIGETVGYRVRRDTRVGPRTRVEVVTEGVLTRMLQGDPALEGVGAVIFDEFHERSLHADLGLALALECRAVLREDLRILVMSATLDGDPVAALLGGAPLIASEGRVYPVETRYLERPSSGPLEPAVARAVREAVGHEEGDILVFLPGAGEIRRVEERLREEELAAGVELLPLFGDLPQEAQARAIRPGSGRRRKVVLSTAIAETSLTIEGVRTVIDAGLMRVPRFSPRTGMTHLETVRVSRASADQRRGRAGRLGPGVCYRLWTEVEDRHLIPHASPEILEADLTPLALELATWGITDPGTLRWLDVPPAGAFAQARELLEQLGALGGDGAVTAHGRRMAELGLHPRLAHMVLRGEEIGLGALGCALAALLAERDPLRGDGRAPEADLRLRLELLAGDRRPVPAYVRGARVDRGAVERARTEARHLGARIGARAGIAKEEVERAGALLALAYPDRVAQRRAGREGRFLLRNGRGAAFREPEPLAMAPYLVAADLGGRGADGQIHLAAPLDAAEVVDLFAEQIRTEEVVAWEPEAGAVRARRRERLGAIVLRETAIPDPDPGAVLSALLQAIARGGLDRLSWSRAAGQLRERLAFLHRQDPTWPDTSEEALVRSLPDWLGPHLYGMRGLDEVTRVDLSEALLATLPWERRASLDELAPTHLEVPSGSRIPIDYSDPDAPVLAVRLQEMFGLRETPRIARGRIPLTLHLLSPGHRPVQVTRDLASFWQGGYFEVRKDLRGRYPKHYWPDDPLEAAPTRRAKPR